MSDAMVYTGLPAAQAAHDSPPPDGPVAPQSLDAGRQAAPFTRVEQHDRELPVPGDAWTCRACHQVFWTERAHTPRSCPRCEHHAANPALPIETGCTICHGTHTPTQCPEVALVKFGMGVWESYIEDKAAFLRVVQWATAQRLVLMGDAVAFYLTCRWGRPIAGYHVLQCWRSNAT